METRILEFEETQM